MKRKVLGLLLFLAVAFLFIGCDIQTTTTPNNEGQSLGTVTIQLEVSGDNPDTATVETEYVSLEKTLDFYAEDTLFTLLTDNFETTYETYSFGHMISTIGDLAPDASSQYIAIYINGTMANLGVDGIPLNDGDVYQFRIESF